jgi:heme-degrading monooxygenase HmoA
MWAGLADQIGQLAPLIRDDLVPRLRHVPGFKGHCTFPAETGHGVSVAIFDGPPNAAEGDRQAEEWMSANVGDGAASQVTELAAGETLLHEVAKLQRNSEPPMFVTLRIFEGVGPKKEVLAFVQQHVFHTITGAAGFRGYYAFLDERDPTRGVSVSLFDDRNHAMQANEWVLSIMRDQQITPKPPRVMVGPTVAVAA